MLYSLVACDSHTRVLLTDVDYLAPEFVNDFGGVVRRTVIDNDDLVGRIN